MSGIQGRGAGYHGGPKVITGQDIKTPLGDTDIGGPCPLGLSWEIQSFGTSFVIDSLCLISMFLPLSGPHFPHTKNEGAVATYCIC